jgi:hypothetical protein
LGVGGEKFLQVGECWSLSSWAAAAFFCRQGGTELIRTWESDFVPDLYILLFSYNEYNQDGAKILTKLFISVSTFQDPNPFPSKSALP